ncbi:MAG: sensor histidine kinase KdpD [Candidatus Magnetoovum sp. WYHC-5]|nr:sensor histidine kinase KdpD [Candidatus Magnetoovum sp. WYHC-5]
MKEERPSPDELLLRVQQEEVRKRQGKLKIFFGAAPGVGKTYAMLEAAHQRQSEGIEVVVGIVETHGRQETEKLLHGLEILQRQQVEYRGTVLYEFDIDNALSRKPELILIDELAHTNAPQLRHKKRWQDVFELLTVGINVYTTINVQHLESLCDVVTQITGVTVRETVPDFVLERADEIGLIDLPPEELLQRLGEGKVYVPEMARRAGEGFFRKGNLMALRELALRRTAERVDEQMQSYRVVQGVREVWPASERILVSVGPNPRSIRLIRAAKRMAVGLRAEWIAVNVEAPSKVKPSKSDIIKLAEHMSLAEKLGAETVTLSGQKASEEILRYARTRNVTKIIIGKPAHPRWKDMLFGSMLDEIVRGSGDIDVYVISGDVGESQPHTVVKTSKQRKKTLINSSFLSILPVFFCTVISLVMFPYVALGDLSMVYLLGVVVMASWIENAPSFLTALLSVLAFDFFFVPPRYTFNVNSPKYLITFAVMFTVTIVISKLTHRVRIQANTARQQHQTTAALFNLSRKMVQEQTIESLSAAAINHISEVFGSSVTLLVPDESGKLMPTLSGNNTFDIDQKELGVAQWAFDHKQKAGYATDTLSGAKALYLPLATASKTVGVVGILTEASDVFFDHRQMHLLESFANQTAMAIERVLLTKEAQQTLLYPNN